MIRPREYTRDFPGLPESVRAARRFVDTALGGCPAADSAILAASELATNAVRWSRSGDPGGTFTVRAAVTPLTGAAVYVCDRGARGGGQVTRGPEGGRGLRIVAAVAEAWGIARAGCGAWTGAAESEPRSASALAADRGGCVVWFRVGWQPRTSTPDGAGQNATWLEVMARAGWRCECAGMCGRSHRCPAEHAAGHPLHLVPVWPATPATAAYLPAAALLALCPGCRTGADRRAAREAAQAPCDALFREGVAR